MAKFKRCGKSEIFDDESYKKLKDCLSSPRDRLIAAICFWTGERISAVLQLSVSDVYSDTRRAVPLEAITFPSKIRKGKRDTRQVPIHPALREILLSYRPSAEGWLFPSPRNSEESLDRTTFDKALRKALKQAGLSDAGFSTHSFRRTFITRLHEQGCSLKVIQEITKHRSITSLAGYVEVGKETIAAAIANLRAA